MTTWQKYEIPIILVSLINILFLWAVEGADMYNMFALIFFFFSFTTFCFSKLIDWCRYDLPRKYVACFVAGKVLKMMATVILVLWLWAFQEHIFLISLLSVMLLYLTTLLVDLTIFVRYINNDCV